MNSILKNELNVTSHKNPRAKFQIVKVTETLYVELTL